MKVSAKERGDLSLTSRIRGSDLSLASRIRGSLLAGALGDALGAPIEFMKWPAIRAKWGPRGLTHFEPAYGVVGAMGAITDDTQMTLFTVEGLIRAEVRGRARGICSPPAVVHHAYRRWLVTQGERWTSEPSPDDKPWQPDGWLVGEKFLHARRAPGTTCLAALRVPERYGTRAQNDSKGCGGVMRAAPVGFLFGNARRFGKDGPAEAFAMSVEIAALTHGHPSGQLPAGVLAAVIHGVAFEGQTLDEALDVATGLLRERSQRQEGEETLAALAKARRLALAGEPSAERVESLGGGWVAEEALAIAVYAALSHPEDLRAALVLAANHSGDSDSTAAICGNLLGAVLGEGALPADWLDDLGGLGGLGGLEGRAVITQLAEDFARQLEGRAPDPGEGQARTAEAELWWERYPGW